MRCGCCGYGCRLFACLDTCCLSASERKIRATADMLFGIVNTETNCCGCKDTVLSKTEAMLLQQVLKDESRAQLRVHAGLITALIEKLQAARLDASEGGSEITREELRDIVLAATSAYQHQAITAIAAEVAREYGSLAAGPATMEREPAGRRRLLG